MASTREKAQLMSASEIDRTLVRLAHEVLGKSADLAQLATVFSSTAGDCDNSHVILETLASADRALSPTRFANSVHNAAAGYWSIATGAKAESTVLCAFDASFGAGLGYSCFR